MKNSLIKKYVDKYYDGERCCFSFHIDNWCVRHMHSALSCSIVTLYFCRRTMSSPNIERMKGRLDTLQQISKQLKEAQEFESRVTLKKGGEE